VALLPEPEPQAPSPRTAATTNVMKRLKKSVALSRPFHTIGLLPAMAVACKFWWAALWHSGRLFLRGLGNGRKEARLVLWALGDY
jgi:hypothetical protein